MKLQKQASRKIGSAKYYKYVVILPPKEIDKVGWKDGEVLEAEVKKNQIILKPKN